MFKKAHELSVLCSVDVAVFVFGNNKKVYEYSSVDMRELIARYQYVSLNQSQISHREKLTGVLQHGGCNEHKGPADFNGGNAGDDDDDEDVDASPPQVADVDTQMMPPQYHGQQQPHFPQIRHHTPSVSPPMMAHGTFQGHPQQQQQQQQHHQRSHTPQPSVGSRPGSRNDMRRMGPNVVPPGAHPGVQYMPTPPIYNHGPHNQPGMMPQHGPQYQYPQQPPQQSQQQQAYMDERRQSAPPSHSFQAPPAVARPERSPQPPHQSIPQISTTPPQLEQREPQPPPPVALKREPADRLSLNTEHAIKKLPQRKTHSIFTPIEENRSILSQHLASFASDSPVKSESVAAAAAANAARTVSPPERNRQNSQEKPRNVSVSSIPTIPEAGFTPPSRTNSFKSAATPGGGGTTAGAARPRGPRLTVQIPDGVDEPSSAVETSISPRPADPAAANQAPAPQQQQQRHNSVVLPPPSPSATTLLSAGATGPPNPFARPPPQQPVTVAETPASALPSRFLGQEFLPSPSSFYNDWNFRANGDNTLPSPLNFATPVVGSFPKDDAPGGAGAAAAAAGTAAAAAPKRKSPEFGDNEVTEGPKRVKVE